MENWTAEDCQQWLETIGDMPEDQQLLVYGFSITHIPNQPEDGPDNLPI